MRTLRLLLYCSAALLLSSTASAATISVPFGPTTFTSGGTPLPSPRTAHFDVGLISAPNPRPVAVSWQIPNLTTANSGQTWSLIEATAAAAGVNWATLEDAIVNHRLDNYFRTEFDTTNGGIWHSWPEYPLISNPGYVMQDLQSIEFELVYFIPTSAQWTYRLIGEGLVIPEPASIVLLLVAHAIAPFRHCRAPGRRQSVARMQCWNPMN